MAWKDTVNLAPRSKIKIAWMPDDRPGTWMYHCHIIEHHAAGMMAHFDVIKGTGTDAESVSPMTHHHHHHSH
jgi:FtsP/CotA-like multicopper oxidase with cupredoxin domain